MRVDKIKNGVVIDHIPCGKAMKIYQMLELDKLDCTVAILKNVQSEKMGKKDIIKIDGIIDLNFEILGYVSPEATVDIIRDEAVSEKKYIELPERLTDVIFCKNPRCITSVERELRHVFVLTDRKKKTYRCLFCDSEAQG